MTQLLTNIDDIRAEIMRLESLTIFKGKPWYAVIDALNEQGRFTAASDAIRRMETARANCDCDVCRQTKAVVAAETMIEYVPLEYTLLGRSPIAVAREVLEG